ncbi:MAG TPA: DNA polymerase III subunit chi [Rubrivivax sp.]|nr:DNA polymerase III subunit chi [Rubrivivax sp.]
MAVEVEFHTGVADPLRFACRLSRKAMRRGARLVCTAPAPLLQELDRALWVFDERDFVPHVRLPATSPDVAARTPIWLCERVDAAALDRRHDRVLVNLGAEAPAEAQRFVRIIEVVGTDAEAAAAGRARWRAYRALGLGIRHHAAGQGGSREAPGSG